MRHLPAEGIGQLERTSFLGILILFEFLLGVYKLRDFIRQIMKFALLFHCAFQSAFIGPFLACKFAFALCHPNSIANHFRVC